MSMPAIARWSLLVLGLLLLAFSLGGFVNSNWLIGVWAWKLSPLTARVVSGWFTLLGVGGIVISRDTCWSAWRVGLQSIGLWHLLVVVGAFIAAADVPGGPAN